MAKTVTISDIRVQSIVINQLPMKLSTDGEPTFTCFVNYSLCDAEGQLLQNLDTTKYMSNSDYSDTLSGDSEAGLKNFISSIKAGMLGREGI